MNKTKEQSKMKRKGSKPLLKTSKLELVKKPLLYRVNLSKTQNAFCEPRNKYAYGKLDFQTSSKPTPKQIKKALEKLKRR